jgi:hypothetical protein
MEPIPDEWVYKLFECMQGFYGERWTRQFKNSYHRDIIWLMWKNGLVGLNYDQIKNALISYKEEAKAPFGRPPSVVRFYHRASDIRPSAQWR